MKRCRFFNLDFFFQAEDGIRDGTVTGVQTCALPICDRQLRLLGPHRWLSACRRRSCRSRRSRLDWEVDTATYWKGWCARRRSEERRVGKECRSGWSAYYQEKKIDELTSPLE